MSIIVVAPARERGLKFLLLPKILVSNRRSREGAWIEISSVQYTSVAAPVAPARERGLKFICCATRSALSMSLPRGSVD